jgi:hypothetical protein
MLKKQRLHQKLQQRHTPHHHHQGDSSAGRSVCRGLEQRMLEHTTCPISRFPEYLRDEELYCQMYFSTKRT